ncbi:hypothetical protein B0J13DRAFT_534081 [Dactylonectria estremocensis]|uniref:Uncharacterized protein n=1 Tax=Dactylonectria estremocensis TaxID=1079267 RepID=A0A9P9D420_9HYPO|nr:hypothetical protein B0J13DRAFT_534081 [Dactylonectria estremocensis]
MALLQYERGMDGSENAGDPGSRVYCQVRAWYSGTHGRQSEFFEPVGAKLGLLQVPALERLGPSASAAMVPGADARSTLGHRTRGPGLYCSSGPGLVSGAVLVGRWTISGSKCEPAVDIEVRPACEGTHQPGSDPCPTLLVQCSGRTAVRSLLSAVCDADSVGRPGTDR